jgi:hypothetical protein
MNRKPLRRLARAVLSAAIVFLVAGGVVALSAQPSAATFRTLSTDWQASLGWCNHSGAQLLIGDFSGGNRDDMLCHDTGNGYKWISYSDL